jgi:hypothetical protein
MIPNIMINIFPHPFPDILEEKSSFNDTEAEKQIIQI